MDNCPICLDSLDKEIISLKCFHIFHYNCIKELFDFNTDKYILSCPLCRTDFNFFEDHYDNKTILKRNVDMLKKIQFIHSILTKYKNDDIPDDEMLLISSNTKELFDNDINIDLVEGLFTQEQISKLKLYLIRKKDRVEYIKITCSTLFALITIYSILVIIAVIKIIYYDN